MASDFHNAEMAAKQEQMARTEDIVGPFSFLQTCTMHTLHASDTATCGQRLRGTGRLFD